MRTVRRLLTAVALAGAALLGPAATTGLADTATPAPSGSASGDAAAQAGPTEAGTSFRTAAFFRQEQQATAQASTGDYLYWVFPADAGGRPTVTATVTLPETALRHGSSTWRIDVYDGLRRRQPCMYGMQSRVAAREVATVELACTLRPVRASADTWSQDPLPGSYFVRLTATALPEEDSGQPFSVRVGVASRDTGGAYATDGALAVPLVPGATTPETVEALAPEDGWSSGWWSDRWLWTAAGGVLAALAGIGGYVLTRGAGRPSRVPPAA
ncbi:hypothetical protein [Streptomyces roseicoloratus]|uniref:Secreted protein n=1 Tax=Streptomyces roseicoloratus TaxID=2508722 RepID=A0ABY9S267_9ACTN|nr:hypothetical protein [Streptomyces roseicoloratus]WMX48513.1 hypothetical protein RGF97_32080 [Streptomyces roseicoloratus]